MVKLTQTQIAELKRKSTPINHRGLKVDVYGKLVSGNDLLSKRQVEGYACLWGEKNSHDEIFVKGAFAKSITEMGPGSKSTYQLKFRDRHGKACSLFEELTEDDTGLYFRTVPLDEVQWCDDLIVQLRSGTINNFSVGFKYNWKMMEYDEKENAFVILEARLLEISAVDVPSDLTTYAMRSSEEEIDYLQDDVEDFIGSLPRSKQLEARHIITRCMSLQTDEPLEQRRQALKETKPAEAGLAVHLNYLTQKISNEKKII